MKGIHYIVDEKGKRKALVIDIKYAKVIEDFIDGLIAEERRKESTRRTLMKVVSKILKKKKVA